MDEQATEPCTKVLESVEQALTQASEQTAQREQELATGLPADDPAGTTADWQGRLGQLEARLQELRCRAEQAEHTAAQADTAMVEAEVAFRQWLAAAERAGQRRVDWTAP